MTKKMSHSVLHEKARKGSEEGEGTKNVYPASRDENHDILYFELLFSASPAQFLDVCNSNYFSSSGATVLYPWHWRGE